VTAAAPIRGAGAVRHGRERREDLELDTDVVVVGSGAGGAVVAAELAEAGQRVIVLEEGPYVPPETIRTLRPSQHLARVWRDAGMTVAVGVGDTPTINVTMGRAVGGSSLVTGAVAFRTPERILDGWVHDLGLTDLAPKHLEAAFDAVERASHVEEVPRSLRSKGTMKFCEGAEKLGLTMEAVRRNTRGCNGCGRCNFGCPHGAKMSVDQTYLPRAVAAGATIWSDCLVDRVLLEGGRAVGVEGAFVEERRTLLPRPFARKRRVRVRARRVVLAAGSYHTPLLLMRSGVAAKNREVGRNMTLHPGFRMFARFEERIDGWKGALQSAYTRSLEDEGITLVGLFVPPGVLAATMPGFGPEHVRRAAQIPHLAVFGGIIHDEGGGVVRAGPGREPIVTYRMHARERSMIGRVMRVMGDAFFAAGAREVFPPILGQPGIDADAFRALDLDRVPALKIECSSQHPLGTCKMGRDEPGSVVDDTGKVWGVDELFVADGSVVPTSLGVNPQITIMAMATRIAWKLRERRLPA
jgi:choline dehydrogenase-like flavoprotein